MVVFLDDLLCASVELDDFLVAHSCNELVVEIGIWIEAYNMRDLASRKAAKAGSSFGIPKLHVSVV